MVVLTIAIIGTMVTNVWITTRQWREMHRQVEMMRDTLSQTERQIELTAAQLELARRNTKNAERSAAAAEAAARIAQRSLEVVERAWVGVRSFEVRKPPMPGETMIARVKWTNTGKTPAIGLSTLNRILYSPLPLEELPESVVALQVADNSDGVGRADLFPGVIMLSDNLLAITDDQFTSINQGRGWVYVIGVITYRDIFRRRHETRYCGVYLAGGLIASCSRYNSTD